MDFRAITLVRRLHLAVRAEIADVLRDQGFADITPAHIYVFQTPGPDGLRPTELAQRALTTKQAMNHLLTGLEERGYLERVTTPGDGRARVLRLTSKGRRLTELIQATSTAIERRWEQRLGTARMDELLRMLDRLDGSTGRRDDPVVAGPQRFTVTLVGENGRVFVPVPVDPDEVWGHKVDHHVHGTVNGMGVRGVIEPLDGGRGLVLGPAWRRGCGLAAGDRVEVVLQPEGPQREDLAPDFAAALAANPEAGAFFDSIAQFYRRAYLRYIDGTKRRPEVRAARIDEVVGLLAAGIKERP
jgi:DNA-binding MarR family transcriptional regulator